jgi:hypothetical protein
MLSIALALALVVPVQDDTAVEVIAVRNRPAADLVSVLESVVAPDGSVAAMENKLIVKAGPRAMQQVRELVASLDVAPRSLWITVRHASTDRSSSRSGAVAASVPAGGTTVEVSPDGASVKTTTTRSHTRVAGAFDASSSQGAGSDVQRLQCLEGRPAYIRVGRAEPVTQGYIVPGPGAPGVATGTAYAEADIGFWVVPHLAGSTVSLDLATSRDAFEASGAIGVRRTSGSVSGRLGEWIPVGGSSLTQKTDERTLASRGSATSDSSWTVDLRVEAVDPQ